jgi:hypothetical protein
MTRRTRKTALRDPSTAQGGAGLLLRGLEQA